jgi:hypothetical protein
VRACGAKGRPCRALCTGLALRTLWADGSLRARRADFATLAGSALRTDGALRALCALRSARTNGTGRTGCAWRARWALWPRSRLAASGDYEDRKKGGNAEGKSHRYGRDCGVRRPEPVGSNAQCEQFNQADPDHQHGECHWIVVEPLPPAVHDTPPVPASLVGPAGKTVQCGAQIPGHETMRHGQPLGGHILGWLSAMTRPSAFAMKSDDEEIESGDHRKSAR